MEIVRQAGSFGSVLGRESTRIRYSRLGLWAAVILTLLAGYGMGEILLRAPKPSVRLVRAAQGSPVPSWLTRRAESGTDIPPWLYQETTRKAGGRP